MKYLNNETFWRLIKLKTIRFTILNLKKFENIIKTPREIDIPEDANIIGFISELDKLYIKEFQTRNMDKLEGFHDNFIKSLLQLMWNPQKLKFYDDVGLGARAPSPDYKFLPVLNDWRLILPDGSNLTVTPLGED